MINVYYLFTTYIIKLLENLVLFSLQNLSKCEKEYLFYGVQINFY
jgi:hypothetical protein